MLWIDDEKLKLKELRKEKRKYERVLNKIKGLFMNDIFDSIEIHKSIDGYTLTRKSAIKLIENLLVKINNKIDIVKCSIKENRKELKITGWDIYEGMIDEEKDNLKELRKKQRKIKRILIKLQNVDMTIDKIKEITKYD